MLAMRVVQRMGWVVWEDAEEIDERIESAGVREWDRWSIVWGMDFEKSFSTMWQQKREMGQVADSSTGLSSSNVANLLEGFQGLNVWNLSFGSIICWAMIEIFEASTCLKLILMSPT